MLGTWLTIWWHPCDNPTRRHCHSIPAPGNSGAEKEDQVTHTREELQNLNWGVRCQTWGLLIRTLLRCAQPKLQASVGGKSVTTELSYNELSLSKGPCEAFQGEKRNNGELLKHLRIAKVVVLGDADGFPLQLPSCFFCLCPKPLFNTFYFQVNFYESESSTFSGHWVELWGFREILYQGNQELWGISMVAQQLRLWQ